MDIVSDFGFPRPLAPNMPVLGHLNKVASGMHNKHAYAPHIHMIQHRVQAVATPSLDTIGGGKPFIHPRCGNRSSGLQETVPTKRQQASTNNIIVGVDVAPPRQRLLCHSRLRARGIQHTKKNESKARKNNTYETKLIGGSISRMAPDSDILL